MSRRLVTGCRLPDGAIADVLMQDGVIVEVGPGGTLAASADVHDAAGALLTPGLTDPHLHPDKAFGLAGAAGSAANVSEAIRAVRAAKPSETAEAIYDRALRLLRWCLSFGTTRVRVHAEVDPLLGLRSVQGVLAARDELADLMQVQIVAFPQEGIVKEPGTLELMRKAMLIGCDVVGAISYQDGDAREHLALAAGLAREFEAPLDVHADFCIPPERSQLDAIADVTLEYGLAGRVAVGHCTTLARMQPETRDAIVARLAACGISVIALPRTDLYLDGAIAPLAALRGAGLTCAIATNNICNAFTPAGRPSLPSVAALYALAKREASKAAMDVLARGLWQAGAICGAESRIEAGAPADLALWQVEEPWQFVAEEAEPIAVFVGGELVYSRSESSIKESSPLML